MNLNPTSSSIHNEHATSTPTTSGSASGERGNPVALQRAALRDLIELSRRCIATDQAIASQRDETIDAAQNRAVRTTQRLEQRRQILIDRAQTICQQRTQRFESEYEKDAAAAKTEHASAGQRLIESTEQRQHDLRQKLDQSLWLADSVYEAEKQKLTSWLNDVKDQVPPRLEALEEVEQRARHWLRVHRQKAPDHAPPTDGEHADGEAAEPQPPAIENPEAAYNGFREEAERRLSELRALKLPSLFRGIRPHLFTILLSGAAVVIAGWIKQAQPEHWPTYVSAGVVTFFVTIIMAYILHRTARSHVAVIAGPLFESITNAHQAIDALLAQATDRVHRKVKAADRKRRNDIHHAKEKYMPQLNQLADRREAKQKQLDQTLADRLKALEAHRDGGKAEAQALLDRTKADLDARYEQLKQKTEVRRQRLIDESKQRHETQSAELEQQWRDGLARIHAFIEQSEQLRRRLFHDWSDPKWSDWDPPRQFAALARFGQMHVEMKKFMTDLPRGTRFRMKPVPPFDTPAMLTFPDRCSMVIQSGRDGLDQTIAALQMVMLRLLTSIPPGRARFTIIDPVGLGENFAGFMHLADHEESLVSGRIWTDAEQIEKRLIDLTNHMENVIQKYLRNEYETIDEYNEQAGELAEPYRFLVVANFPVNFTDEAARRLRSIATSGSRCGVYTLIALDSAQTLPAGIEIEDLAENGVNLVRQDGKFVWADEVFEHFDLTLDAPPSEQFLTKILNTIGRAAKDSSRVEVAFEAISPPGGRFWSADCTKELRLPIGRTGAARLQNLSLGRGVAQHALIAGKTGSGKSTLLHAITTNLAMWYGPDEVEFYLIDFKKGVEFKTYATHGLPHARAIAIESDREFGLSVLQRLDAEMERRGDVFRRCGVQDLAGYRQTDGAQPMPRTLLIIDEFQEFFSEDDRLAQDAALLLDRLVRQGRAFGIHVVLGSQTLGGTSGLARSTIGQMAVRIALQCSEADSQLILADNNTAARLLARPGEAIYNDTGGLIEGNSLFQIAWLSDEQREQYLRQIEDLAAKRGLRRAAPIVFEGNAAADLTRNPLLADLLAADDWPARSADPPRAWLGEAIAIKDPTAVSMRRLSGANLLMIGQRDDAAIAMISSAMISLAAHHTPDAARFVIFDGTPADSALAGVLNRVGDALPHNVQMVEFRNTAGALSDLAAEVARRQEADSTDAQAIYVFLFGLQRYRLLRKQEESFGFSMSDEEEKPPAADKQFGDLLRDGPATGVHCMVWCDTPAALDRTLDRRALGEFDYRLLFQMSATDSSNLIDSPAANKLGFYRALLYSEEQGTMEKFRPYSLPPASWIEQVQARLSARTNARRT